MLSSAEVAEMKAALALAQTDIPGWTHSSLLKMADRATHSVFATVGQVRAISGLQLGGEHMDVSSHLSGGWKEKINVLKDGGRLAFSVHFLESDGTLNLSTGLAAAALEQSLEVFQMWYTPGTGLQFAAFVSLKFEAPVNGRLLGMVTLDVSGAVTVL